MNDDIYFKGANIGIDDEDDSTFTINCDQKTFHFQGIWGHKLCFLKKWGVSLWEFIICYCSWKKLVACRHWGEKDKAKYLPWCFISSCLIFSNIVQFQKISMGVVCGGGGEGGGERVCESKKFNNFYEA